MIGRLCHYLGRDVTVMVAALVLVTPLVGCGGAPVEKSPEDVEKSRQEHGRQSQRELEDG